MYSIKYKGRTNMKIENRRKGSCTTVLVGKKASIDGSTMIARNDDGHEALDPQRFIVIEPENQDRKSVV